MQRAKESYLNSLIKTINQLHNYFYISKCIHEGIFQVPQNMLYFQYLFLQGNKVNFINMTFS